MTRRGPRSQPTRRLRFAASAVGQLEDALAFIAADDPAAAARLAAALEKRLVLLKRLPMSGRVVPELGDPARREVIVPPFRIVYRTLPTEIRVLAVVHGRQLLSNALPDEDEPGTEK